LRFDACSWKQVVSLQSSEEIAEREFVYRVPNIARAVNDTKAAVYHRLARKQMPGARKIGGIWALHLPTYRQSFLDPAARPARSADGGPA
jgi:hypothetical protein